MQRLFAWLMLVGMVCTAQSQDYFQPISMEGVVLKGTVTEAVIDKFSVMDPGLYTFPFEHKFEPLPNNLLLPVKSPGGSVCHDGKLYCNIYDDTRNLADQKPHWTIYDANTFEVLTDIELESGCKATTKTLAYDVTTDRIYGVVETFTEFFFVSIDPASGAMEQLGERFPIEKKFVAMACSKQGVLYTIYCYNSQFYLAKVRKSDGKIANVGIIEPRNLMKYDAMINFCYDQSLFFNTATGKLYWMFGSSSIYLEMEYTAIMEVDPQLATATLVSYIPKLLHVSGAYFDEPLFSAPRIAEEFEYAPSVKGSLEGCFSLRLPQLDYGGTPLEGTLTAVICEGGEELARLEGRAGELVVSKALNLSAEQHSVSITVANEAGENGPTIERNFFVGYDIPGPCTHIQLTSNGLQTILSWDPPTEGIHGETINPDKYTYKVVRYPNEVTVVEHSSELTFSETHPEEMTRYVYKVTAIDEQGREGKGAFSNNLIVGKPLDVPYGGPFSSAADLFNYYTIIDHNNDGVSWNYDQTKNYAFYSFSPYQDADDWLISPEITYKKGVTYVLKFKTFSLDGNYPEALEVKWGDHRHPDSFYQDLLFLSEVPAMNENQEGPEYQIEVSVPYDGIYHYGFHVVSPAYSANLYLYDISIAEKTPSSVAPSQQLREVRVEVGRGEAIITNPYRQSISLYTSVGQLLYQSCESTLRCPLSSGTYILESGSCRQKFIIY